MYVEEKKRPFLGGFKKIVANTMMQFTKHFFEEHVIRYFRSK